MADPTRPALHLVREPPPTTREDVPWAELHVHSTFSFKTGASDPAALVAEAAALGVTTLALTDRDGLYGARRLAEAAREHGVGTVYGAELSLPRDLGLGRPVVLARSLEGWRRLSAAISAAQLAGAKGAPRYDVDLLAQSATGGHWAVLTGCPDDPDEHDVVVLARRLEALGKIFGETSVHAELIDHHLPLDNLRNDALFVAAHRTGAAVVATGAVHYASPRQARLAQALAALRQRQDLAAAAGHLMPAPTAHLRSGSEMQERFSRYPGVLDTTVDLGRACTIDLDELRPALPGFPVPDGHDEASWLRHLAEEGCERRYGSREDPRARAAWAQLERELQVITALDLPGYFLIVNDIVRFAAAENVWCQGRGSAVSSITCYVLGITQVEPLSHGLLFERFLHMERSDPPDIDIDFENGAPREKIIQYLYARYGRDHCAQVANIISYQPRLAVQDAARALGYPPARRTMMTRHIHHEPPGPEADIPADVRVLAAQFHTLPSHLGVHSGGMVLTRDPIGTVMPVEWATADGRSVLQGDKDDCASAKLVKIDILGLGILSALHTACDLVFAHYGIRIDLASIPPDDPAVYAMIARADTIGCFQVESRAQISTLPLLKPKSFQDLVVAVSIIRPGPIQAGSKHPYLRRRSGQEEVTYPHPLARPALEDSLGVALWQEQAMKLAIDCAGFTPGESDRLRKAMAAKHAPEKVGRLRTRLLEGMTAKGIEPEAASQICGMIEAFSNYGFPASHAQSMAHLVYASAWLRKYYPAPFTAALLAHQPMGFYDDQTLIQDAKGRGITVLGVDVQRSAVRAGLEPDPQSADGHPAIRLGLGRIEGVGSEAAQRIVDHQPYADLADLAARTRLSARALETLATAGALDAFGTSRREILWTAASLVHGHQDPLPGLDHLTPAPALPPMTSADLTAADIRTTGSSPRYHPVHHLRPQLQHARAQSAATVRGLGNGTPVRLGGQAKYLQRPPTARGVAFGVLEDESGTVNLVFQPHVWTRYHQPLLDSAFVLLDGYLERSGATVNVVVDRVRPFGGAGPRSRRRGRRLSAPLRRGRRRGKPGSTPQQRGIPSHQEDHARGRRWTTRQPDPADRREPDATATG